MATNIGPIILGLGAAFLFLRSKDSSAAKGSGAPGAGLGGDPGGTDPCHLLTGVWAQANPAATSPLAMANGGFTNNPKLVILPLTPDAFKAADIFFMSYFNGLAEGEKGEQDVAVFLAEKHLTEGLDCPWGGSPNNWTARMHNVHNALVVLFNEGQYPGA